MVDNELNKLFDMQNLRAFDERRPMMVQRENKATQVPVKSKPPLPVLTSPLSKLAGRIAIAAWQRIPLGIRPYIKRLLGRV